MKNWREKSDNLGKKNKSCKELLQLNKSEDQIGLKDFLGLNKEN